MLHEVYLLLLAPQGVQKSARLARADLPLLLLLGGFTGLGLLAGLGSRLGLLLLVGALELAFLLISRSGRRSRRG